MLLRLPCGTALTLDPDDARRTGQALIDAGRNSLPRRNPGNLPDQPARSAHAPRWIIIPIAFFVGAGLLAIPGLMLAEPAGGLLIAAVLIAALITVPIARGVLRGARPAEPPRQPKPRHRVLRLVAGRDVRPQDVRVVTQRIGKKGNER